MLLTTQNAAPSVEYYEIIARNDGRSSATNMTLSIFFNAKIEEPKVMLHSEDVESGKNGTTGKLSFNSFFLPRLASGAVIIIRANVTNGTVLDPYFVSAAMIKVAINTLTFFQSMSKQDFFLTF